MALINKKLHRKNLEEKQTLPYQSVSMEDIYKSRNKFSAPAENFMNTQPGFILKGPIILIFIILFVALIYSIFAEVDTKVVANLAVVGEEYYVQSPVTGSVNAMLIREDDDIKSQQELISIVSEEAIAAGDNINEAQRTLEMATNEYKEVCFALLRLKQISAPFGSRNKLFQAAIDYNDIKPSEDIVPGQQVSISDGQWKNSEYFHQIAAISVKLNEFYRGYERSKSLLTKQEKTLTEDKKLFERDVITEYQLNASNQNFLNLNSSTEGYINLFKLEIYNTYQNLISRKKNLLNTILELKSQTDQFLVMTDDIIINDRICKIISKYPGVVSEVFVKPFEYVARGTGLMKIVRNDINVSAMIYLTDENIGSVKKGQSVNIKLEPYPYQDFGVQLGRVVSISPEVKLLPDMGYVYETQVVFEKLNPRIRLKYGMRGLAEVQTGSKRMIETFFAPIGKVFDYIRGIDSQH